MMQIKKGIPLIDQYDKNCMWGGKFGGNFVPETLKKPIDDLTKLFEKLRKDKSFIKERDYYFKNYVGAPTPFIRLDNLTDYLGGAQIWAKVVSENPGTAHKVYNVLVHCLMARRAGKKYVCTDTGAGMNGKNLAMVGKMLGLKVKIFMGSVDIQRQKKNVEVMKEYGADVIPVTTGSQTLVDAVSECMRYFVANCDSTHLVVGSAVGPAVWIRICAWAAAQISKELIVQIKDEFGKIPKKLKLLNCIGGGSSALGFWNEFIDYDKEQVELIGVEAGGSKKSKKHAAPLTNGSKIGILHGSAQYVIQDEDGQIGETESISAGLDYPGISAIHCFLKDVKRARYTSATDEEALNAYKLVTKFENISPSLEPSHAFAEAIKIAPKLSQDTVLCINSCGHSLKDSSIIKSKLGYYTE
jgi:tryptophan synthase beta subunit